MVDIYEMALWQTIARHFCTALAAWCIIAACYFVMKGLVYDGEEGRDAIWLAVAFSLIAIAAMQFRTLMFF